MASRTAMNMRRALGGLVLARTLNTSVQFHPAIARPLSSTARTLKASTGAKTGDAAKSSPRKSLGDLLGDSIKSAGPISVSAFMRICLLDPSQGYYASANSGGEASRDVLGARGDFITSPEISQMFGELLAVYFISRWEAAGEPQNTRLVEFGPGKGTLLADMIRVFGSFPFIKSLKTIHLVETSDGLMRLQLKAIDDALATIGKRMAHPTDPPSDDTITVEYFPTAASVPVTPQAWTMVVAHEFFDALPIHIFEKTTQGFREVLVGLKSTGGTSGSTGGTTETQKGQSGITTIKVSDLRGQRTPSSSPGPAQFHYVLSPTETPWSKLLASANSRFTSLQPGQRVEVSPEAWATARRIGELVSGRDAPKTSEDGKVGQHESQEKTAGGSALIVDYGDEKAFGGSFRAFKNHAIVDPLLQPGTADLTANVDFAYLKNALRTTDARTLGPMFQSHYLASMGLNERMVKLMDNADPERQKIIDSGAQRLIDPTGMGKQYKVMGVESRGDVGEGVEEVKEENKVWPFDFEWMLKGALPFLGVK